jgi:hypothetical protein
MKKQILNTLTYITFVVFAVSCTQKTSDLETEKSTQIEQENEYMSDESDVSPVSSGCKDKFEYKNNELVYVSGWPCDYWEEKLDEYLNRNNDKISDDQEFQNLSSDFSLKPYVKKIYGFSTLKEAKQAYIDAGGNGTGSFRFAKPPSEWSKNL